MTSRILAAAAILGLFSACGKTGADSGEQPASAELPARDVALFVGDSLTAGYGVALDEAYPALLEARWRARGIQVKARNAGVSGATSAGVLENIDWSLTPDVRMVVVAVGANDGLRGLDLTELEKNIDSILVRVRTSKVQAVLAGMKLPPNYGPEYTRRFEAVYPRLAKKHGVPLIPFLLEGVAGVKELNQSDGIHPDAAGHERIAETVDVFLTAAGLP